MARCGARARGFASPKDRALSEIRLFVTTTEKQAEAVLDRMSEVFGEEDYAIGTTEVDEKRDVWEASIYMMAVDEESVNERLTEALSEDRVAMGSTVTYVEEPSGMRRTVTITYPADADLALRKISVLSPIGRSLLGRRRGDIIDVALPGDRLLEIRIADTAHRKLLQEAA